MHHLSFLGFTPLSFSLQFILLLLLLLSLSLVSYFTLFQLLNYCSLNPPILLFFSPVLPLGWGGDSEQAATWAKLLSELLAVLFGTKHGTQKVEIKTDLTKAY